MRRWRRRAREAERTVEAVRYVAGWWAGDTGGDWSEDFQTAAAVLRGILDAHDRATDRP